MTSQPAAAPSSKDLRLPSLSAIQAFEAVARLGSFERAAEELNITASAVGKRVGVLEQRIGTSLLVRSSRSLGLTVAGREYVEQVRAALGMLAQVSLHQRPARRSEKLRLVAPPTFSRQILIPHLEDFTQRYPEIELELLLSIPYLDNSSLQGDIEIRFGKGIHQGLVAQRLIEEAVFPACSPAYLARMNAAGGCTKPHDLTRATLIRCTLDPWKPWLDAAGLAVPEPASGPLLGDLGLVLEAAVNGFGIALVRRSLAQSWLQAGTLVRLFDIEARPASFYYVCHEATRPLEGGRAVFVEWLMEKCAALNQALAWVPQSVISFQSAASKENDAPC